MTVSTPTRPMPIADPDTQPFWDGCARGVLLAQRCTECKTWRWPPMAFCPACHVEGGEWVELPGTGTVATFVVVHRSFHPAFVAPYVIAHVVLDGTDGVAILRSNILGVEPDEVAVGMAVTVDFENTPGLPLFVRADQGKASA